MHFGILHRKALISYFANKTRGSSGNGVPQVFSFTARKDDTLRFPADGACFRLTYLRIAISISVKDSCVPFFHPIRARKTDVFRIPKQACGICPLSALQSTLLHDSAFQSILMHSAKLFSVSHLPHGIRFNRENASHFSYKSMRCGETKAETSNQAPVSRISAATGM